MILLTCRMGYKIWICNIHIKIFYSSNMFWQQCFQKDKLNISKGYKILIMSHGYFILKLLFLYRVKSSMYKILFMVLNIFRKYCTMHIKQVMWKPFYKSSIRILYRIFNNIKIICCNYMYTTNVCVVNALKCCLFC